MLQTLRDGDSNRDVELLLAWRDGQRAAGERLFEKHYRSVSRFFATKVREDPVDLIQDTFERCLRGRDRLADAEHFRSYLFGIAYNVLREHYRGRPFDPMTMSAADLAPGPGTLVADAQEHRLLLEAMRTIPLRFQIVLELFYWEGLTSAAIAVSLDEPPGTIRTRIRRGRELLRGALEAATADRALAGRAAGEIERWDRAPEATS